MIRADARLRVVLVNFNGGALLSRAVRSVIASQWPGQIDVVIVDNASSDGSLADVESLDAVTIIRRESNEGFGANNHGFSDLLGDEIEADLAPADVVALLNPDAMVAPSTFRLLAAALDEDAKIGAASPLIVFDRSFIEVHVDDGDLVIDSVTTGAEELASQCHGVRGAERLPGATGPIWLCPPGSILRIPVDSLGTPVVLGVADGSARLDGTHIEGPTERALQPAARPTHRIVQNAGTFIGRRGSGINRGFTQRTTEDLGPDAPLWCGAAVVFHPDYLRAIGGFDPEYFLYYEDVDLALRGLAQGWTTDIATGFAQAALTPLSLAYSALRTPGQRAERLRLARWRARALAQAARGASHARVARGEIDSTRVVGAADVRRLAGRDPDSTG